jgi:hypothetical protein
MIHQELSDGKCITTHDNGEKMPGPVSDSYDPEFSTSDRATRVREAIMQQRDSITQILGEQLLHIVSVVDDEFEPTIQPQKVIMEFTERELRIIRFALNIAIDSI